MNTALVRGTVTSILKGTQESQLQAAFTQAPHSVLTSAVYCMLHGVLHAMPHDRRAINAGMASMQPGAAFGAPSAALHCIALPNHSGTEASQRQLDTILRIRQQPHIHAQHTLMQLWMLQGSVSDKTAR
jgi:hypothetical protein